MDPMDSGTAVYTLRMTSGGPEPCWSGGLPPGDWVERGFARLKQWRGIATRCDIHALISSQAFKRRSVRGGCPEPSDMIITSSLFFFIGPSGGLSDSFWKSKCVSKRVSLTGI